MLAAYVELEEMSYYNVISYCDMVLYRFGIDILIRAGKLLGIITAFHQDCPSLFKVSLTPSFHRPVQDSKDRPSKNSTSQRI